MSIPLLRWTLRAIARYERAGERPPRITDPEGERWSLVRRNLGDRELVRLLHDDVAAAFPTAFDLDAWPGDPLAALSDAEATSLIEDARLFAATQQNSSDRDPAEIAAFLRTAARGLGLPAGGALADLPRISPRQRALELPGSGGRVAAAMVMAQEGLSLSQHFVFAPASDAERVLLGITALELRASGPLELRSPAELASTRTPGVDRAVGLLDHPPAAALAATLGLEARLA